MALFDYDPLGYTGLPDTQVGESAGLLGGIKKYMADPRNQAGLAAFGRALAQAGAPRRGPLTWGGGLSDAFAGMSEGQQGYDSKQFQRKFQEMKMREMETEAAKQQAEADKMKQAQARMVQFQQLMGGNSAMGLGAQQGDVGPTMTNASRIPQDPLAELRAKSQIAMGGGFTDEGMKMFKQARDMRDKFEVAPSGEVFNPYAPDPSKNYGKVSLEGFGGYKQGVNPAGQVVGGRVNMTQSPDSVATNAVQWAKFNRDNENKAAEIQRGKWQYDATRGGFVNAETSEFKPAMQDGKPIETKASREATKEEARRKSIIEGGQNVLDTIKEAKGMVGYNTTGLAGGSAYIPSTEGRTLAGKIKTIQANLGFDRLQQMRQESPTGGALGQVAVQELMALQSTVASLDQLQKPSEVKAALEKVEKHYNGWLNVMKQAGGQGGDENDPLGLRNKK